MSVVSIIDGTVCRVIDGKSWSGNKFEIGEYRGVSGFRFRISL